MSLNQKLVKTLKYSLLTIASLFVILFISISLLLFTHTGNNTLFALIKKFETRLTIELVEGSLFDSPHFENISWHDGETSVDIESVDFTFNWACLYTEVCLDSLNVEGAMITLPAPAEDTEVQTESESSVVIDLPIDIQIDNISLSRINFVMGELSVELNKLSLQANGAGNDVSLSSQINGLLVTLPDAEALPNKINNTQVTASSSKKVIKKKMDLNIASVPAILQEGMLPTVKLPINLNLESFVIDNFKLVQNKTILFELNTFETALTFKESTLGINNLTLDIPETKVTLNGEINFIDHYPLSLNIEGKVKKVKQLQPETLLTDLNYALTTKGSLSDLTTNLKLSNKVDLQLMTHLDLFADNLPHTLKLNWQNLNWPLAGESQYGSKQGSLSSQGSLNNHKVNLKTDYELTGLPSGKVSLKTQGDLQHLKVESLKVNTLDGEVDFSGLLTWKDKVKWLGQLKLADIDLKELETAYNGHFSGLIKQQVEVVLYENSKPDWQFDFPSLTVDGELLERPLNVSGRIMGNNKTGINFQNVNIKNAENTLLVNGLFAEQNNLDIALNIADLSHALLNATGKIQGNVKVAGPLTGLNINSDLIAEELSYDTYQVEKLTLESKLIIAEKPSLVLDLNASEITANEQLIDDLTIQISNEKVIAGDFQHQIDLIVNSKIVSTDLSLYVTQTKDELLTQFEQATFYLPHQELHLLKPFAVTQKDSNINLTEHCWQVLVDNNDKLVNQEAGKLCINRLNVGETGDINFDIDEYLLTNLNPFLPEELRLTGAISADANVQWEKEQKPNFTVKLISDDVIVQINSDLKTKKVNEYPLEKFNLDLNGSDEKIDINADIFSEKLVNIKVNGQVTPYENVPTLNSTVDINFPDFELFLPLIPALEKLQGELSSQLTITGNLNKPTVNGQISIENGLISALNLPMKIYELQTLVKIDDTRADLVGSFNTTNINTVGEKVASIPLLTNTLSLLDKSVKQLGSIIIQQEKNSTAQTSNDVAGLALIKGQFDWSEKIKGEVEIYGHKLEIYDYGKIDLLISPDIHVEMNDNLSVNGDLKIDKGKLVVKDLPAGAVSQSKDIIIVDVKKEKIVPELPIFIDLTLDMGQEFQLVALGLDTFIEGKLLVKQPLKKDLTINGELSFTDGSYRSLGQQLVLQNSRVVFQGSPESPYLSIEAIRDPDEVEDDVTAGVRVTGTPDQLELVIFSDPAMAQQQALSYLTRGKSLDSSSESSSMANMLIDIAAGQSDGLMSSIGEGVGIKDLSLSSSGSGDEQSVGVRGEVAPGIELSYGVGVFDSFSIFAIRYKLFEKFYIEASSGVDQAIDAYYEWDWD
jgi:translocation and assembly module TamB